MRRGVVGILALVCVCAVGAAPAVAASKAATIRTGTFKGTLRIVYPDGSTFLGTVTLKIGGPLRNLDNAYRVTFAGTASGTWKSYGAPFSYCKVTNPSAIAANFRLNAQSVNFSKGHAINKLVVDIQETETGTLNLLCSATDGSTYTQQTSVDSNPSLSQGLLSLNIAHIAGAHTFNGDNPPNQSVTIRLPG